MFCFQLGSTSFQAVKTEKSLKRNYVIKVVSMKYTGNFLLHEGSYHVQPQHQNFLFAVNGTQRGKNALYVCTVVCKRHLLSQSDIKQWKDQAHNLNHCWSESIS